MGTLMPTHAEIYPQIQCTADTHTNSHTYTHALTHTVHYSNAQHTSVATTKFTHTHVTGMCAHAHSNPHTYRDSRLHLYTYMCCMHFHNVLYTHHQSCMIFSTQSHTHTHTLTSVHASKFKFVRSVSMIVSQIYMYEEITHQC